MHEFKNILVPVDGSEISSRAVDKAVALAKKGGKAFAAAVVVPAAKVAEKKGGLLAKEVAGKGMDVVINVVKKKIQ